MLVCLIPSVAGQLKAAGSAFQVLLNMPYMTAIIVFGAIVLIYTLLAACSLWRGLIWFRASSWWSASCSWSLYALAR